MSITVLSGKVFLIVTGASRGIGKQIAESFSKLLKQDSHILLLARNIIGLQETARKLGEHVKVDCMSVDLCKATKDELQEIIHQSYNKSHSDFDRIVVVHNVGSIGDVGKKTTELDDYFGWREYYDLNVFSPAILNGIIIRYFKDKKDVKKVIINITSLCGIKPMKCAAYYCSGKAAREMFFKVFAEEYPDIDVLNYSPGPVKTDMLNTLMNDIGDPEVKAMFNENAKSILTVEQTVEKLLKILKEHKYKSGDHVDYFDVE